MPQPLSRLRQLGKTASEALVRRDWVNLRFSAQLMCEEAPNSPAAWSYLGVAFFQLGKERKDKSLVARGLECHETAYRYGPDDSMAVANLGFALNMLGRHKEALAVLAPATDLFPDNPHMLAHRAHAELGLNQLDAAGKSADRILRLVKEADGPVLTLHRLYLSDHLVVPLLRPLDITIHRLDKGFACEESDFDLYGTGGSFKAALIDLCEYFVTLVEEYANTEAPLDQGAQKLAERLRAHIGPGFAARIADRAG